MDRMTPGPMARQWPVARPPRVLARSRQTQRSSMADHASRATAADLAAQTVSLVDHVDPPAGAIPQWPAFDVGNRSHTRSAAAGVTVSLRPRSVAGRPCWPGGAVGRTPG